MNKILAGIAITLLAGEISAQNIQPCVTDHTYQESVKQHPELKAEEQRATQIAAATPFLRKAGTVKYIPVVFHVIHKYGFENISITQLNDALRVMNEDLRKMTGTNGGSSTDPLATDVEYEFRLAQFDPNGLPTNGVNRIYSTGTDDARDAQKALSYWDARKYFNIWIVNTIYNNTGGSGTVLGYAQFPFQINSQTSTDGVMARADQLGVIEFADPSQSGRTLTHESGHWLGLYHPFQGGCVGGTTSTCATQGDQVCDTPPVATATTGCPSSRNSCTNDVPDKNDLVKNYMDYADGNCMNMFTPGQKTRMDQMMNTYRSNVYSSANLSAIGINTDGTYKTLTPSSTKAPYSYGFDAGNLNGSGWGLENYMSPGDSGWQINNSVAHAGTGCLAAMNFKNSRLNIRNAFTSPSIDVTTLSSPTLSFYLAYAKKISVSGDRVRIFISNSFGRSEILARTILATELESAPVNATSFTPSASEWKKFTLDLSPYKAYTNLKIRVELQSLRGNNIYFDDFMISEPTGINNVLSENFKWNIFPNPAKDNMLLHFDNMVKAEMEFSLLNLEGKEVEVVASQLFEAGEHELNIDISSYAAGLYFMRVKTPDGQFVHKIIIE